MANNIDLTVTLKNELDKVGGSVSKLKEAGAFSGAGGAKQLNTIQALLASLQATDLSKLKGPELTKFLNDLAKLRQFLDTAARGLTNFSEDYKKALDKVEAATKKVALAQDRLASATQKQLDATTKASEGVKQALQSGFKYKNTETGGFPKTPKSIAEAYSAGHLEVYSPKSDKPLHDASLDAHLQKIGIPDLAGVSTETESFKKALKDAEDELKKATEQLEKTPTGGEIHPVTKQVVQESAGTRQIIGDIKDSLTADAENNIRGVNEEAEKFNFTLNKQSNSLGRAFKQFSIYAIALRTVKKALSEATKTIRELDRALTEQAMVTGLTRKQTYGLLKDYQSMAARLGATTKEVASTMTEFLRQGRSIAEASKLTEAAVAAAKVAGISAADSINYLTTAINGFRLSAEDAMKVSDKFAAVAATAAVSYEEIAVALSKVAAQANLAGMSIDYTTALLTKGIETTREAPETIGTALKTVIARMRELGDYGETLEGDTDVNNVETQLAYIGIQLRDNNGELRSTEDVLNELGAQWDDLNANQQAAIAKALAGTRQQSRLIAMMQDYERVTELQQVAARSAGSTMAQMATYLEGMDAALNKVNLAWEEIISAVTNSDVLIGLVNGFANMLENISGILSQTWGMVAALTIISTLGISILGNKLRELELAHLQKEYTLEQQELETKKNIEELKAQIAGKKAAVDKGKAERIAIIQARKEQIAHNKQVAKEALMRGQATKDAKLIATAQKWIAQFEADELKADKEIAAVRAETYETVDATIGTDEARLKILEKQEGLLKGQETLIAGIGAGILGMITPIGAIVGLVKAISVGIKAAQLYQAKLNATMDITAAKEARNNALAGAGMFAKVVAAFASIGPWGVVAGIALGAALAAAIGVAIAAATGSLPSQKDSDAKAAENINKLSKSIYDLNKKATALDNTIDKFDALDKKVIKTNKDLEEMSSLLESAADSLSEEEQAEYKTYQTDRGRREYLEKVANNTRYQLANKREKQRRAIIGANRDKLLYSDDSAWVQARDAMYALNNANLYAAIDKTEGLDKATEKFVQTLLEEMSASEALALIQNPARIDDYIQSVQHGIGVFTDEEKSLKDRVAAYRELRDSIDSDLKPAFLSAFKEWEKFEKLKDTTLDWIDEIGASIDDLNDLTEAMRQAGIREGDELATLEALVDEVANSGLKAALESMFGDKAQDMLKAYEKAFGTTLLNMGQDMEKFNNKIDNFYKKAAEWSTMSYSDRTSFISENAAMFEGEEGQKLLDAFNRGDYAQMQAALATNTALQKERDLLIKNLEIQIEIEKSRENINYAHLQELEEYKRYLEDEENLYLASLETRLNQQKDQLDVYKEYLQKENDALTEALEKRKEAYQKYFDEINEEKETEEYEDKAQMLIANISKLSSSTHADAMAKSADLQRQLKELEKERLQTLREQAQERVIQEIDDEVTKISDNLEKLLNNEQALLTAMLNDTQSPEQLVASMVASQFATGNNTELGMQSYLQQLQTTFAMLMPDIDWSQVSAQREGDSLILNIMGQQVTLSDSEQQSVYDAVTEALRQIGKN